MALHIPWEIVDLTTSPELQEARATNTNRRSGYDQWWSVETAAVTDSLLDHLAAVSSGPFAETVQAIQEARQGRFRSISNRLAGPEVLLAYLRIEAIDGWVYGHTQGHHQPFLVTDQFRGITPERELQDVR